MKELAKKIGNSHKIQEKSVPAGVSLPDEAARDRIKEDLDRTLFVEAGAGSGKTESLVDRMIALLGAGKCTVGQLAALTFTRKAPAERVEVHPRTV